MTLTFDNLDGQGAIDYSAAVVHPNAAVVPSNASAVPSYSRSETLRILRTLNAPTVVKGLLCLEGSALREPVRQARVVLSAESGTVLFTGYLASEPVALYAGTGSAGPIFRLSFSAVSDEWLLDKQAAGAHPGTVLGGFGSSALASLAARLDRSRLNLAGLGGGRTVGVVAPAVATLWSTHAATIAEASYASYRALEGALSLNPAGGVVHPLAEGDGSLSIAALRTGNVRDLANDVTVSGLIEPSTFWTELFQGDGTTADFLLEGEPAAPAGGHASLLADPFTSSVLDRQTWLLTDPGSHLALGGTGLQLNGGNGIDGETTLAAYDQLELGGTVVLELSSVALNAGSAGVLGGLYQGTTEQNNCFAGFHVAQSGGNTVLAPLVNGLVTGTSTVLTPGHLYTLRLHLHCPELLRQKQIFYSMVSGVVEQFGGGLVAAPLGLVFELRDLGGGSNTPVEVLYDGTVANSPAQATVVAANSIQLFGSIGAVHLTRTGTAAVRSTDPATGEVSTRLAGRSTDGVDYRITSGAEGKVTFFPGRVPAPNSTLTVNYRGRRRAVARLCDPASIAAEAAGGSPGTARWAGEVLSPPARTSEDCEHAAEAILSFATDRAAAVAGEYVTSNRSAQGRLLGDIWPGDVLALATGWTTTAVTVRKVEIEDEGAAPEALQYRIGFANDWADSLGLKLSEHIAPDTLLPATALSLPPGAAAPVLPNLVSLSIPATSGSALTVDAGIEPPTGGGFEVRRRDGGFGSGAGATTSGDLLLRSPVRGFTIPRNAFEEKFFVRMYDGSTPPLYSRESAAIVTHLPVA